MSKSTNDHKLEGLQNYLEKTGQIDDLEHDLLVQLNSNQATEEQINDLWYEYLYKYKGLRGHINDMFYEFLSRQGFEGHINDMWHDFWEFFVGFEPPPREPYEFEMPGGTVEIYQFEDFGDYEFQITVIP